MNRLWLVVILASATLSLVVPSSEDYELHWAAFKANHGKDYKDPEEERRRKEIFISHIQNVAEHNAKFDMGLVSYQMSVNHPHADMSHEMLANTMLGALPLKVSERYNETDFSKKLTLGAASVDWRGNAKGRVTSVKNQGHCGSCWAFATIGALEGQFATCGQRIQELSMQYLMDCSDEATYYTAGCGGGNKYFAMKFIKANGGIPLLTDYPYTTKHSRCPCEIDLLLATTGTIIVGPSGDEEAVAKALETKGPLSASFRFSGDFQNFKSGIYESTQCEDTTEYHAVLLVGYGTENGKDFWIIKNSWGPEWGEKGYFRFRRNHANMCKIASSVYVPEVDCTQFDYPQYEI